MEKEEEKDLDNMEDEKLEQNSETESEESENSSMEYEISNNESDEDLVNFSEISLDDVGTIDSFNQDLEDACSVFSSIYSYAGIDINARDNKEETEVEIWPTSSFKLLLEDLGSISLMLMQTIMLWYLTKKVKQG